MWGWGRVVTVGAPQTRWCATCEVQWHSQEVSCWSCASCGTLGMIPGKLTHGEQQVENPAEYQARNMPNPLLPNPQ